MTPEPGISRLNYVGIIEEETSVSLSFRVQGTVRRTYVTEGQRVAKGALLAELDAGTLQQSCNAAKASLEQAEDAMKRMKLLYDGGSLPEIKYIETQTRLEQARSMYEISRQNLADSKLYAPVDGVVGRHLAEAGENVMAGRAVFTLLDIRTVRVKISVPEREVRLLSLEAEANVNVPALGREYTGKVSEKGVMGNALTHAYDAGISLSNADGQLMPGMVCNVSLDTGEVTNVSFMVVPNHAVQVSDTGRRFVWCVQHGKATAVTVETGGFTERGVQIVSGLSEGMEVIVEGMQKVGEGTKVKTL